MTEYPTPTDGGQAGERITAPPPVEPDGYPAAADFPDGDEIDSAAIDEDDGYLPSADPEAEPYDEDQPPGAGT